MTPLRYPVFIILALGFLGLGAGFSLRANPPDLVIPWQESTVLSLFKAQAPEGTVLIVHSVYQDRETTYPLARVLQRSGLNAVSVHLSPGRAFHEYVATLKSLCRRFESEGPIFAVGHSMGADLICTLAAEEKSLSSLVALGFPANTDLLECPALLGAGAWDQIHSRQEIQKAAKDSPTVFSPNCDHSQESLDHVLQNAILSYFGREPVSYRGNTMLGHGLIVLGLSLLIFLTMPVALRGRKTAVVLIIGLVFSSVFAGASSLVGTVSLALYSGIALSNAKIEERLNFLRSAFSQLGLLLISVTLFWGLYRYTSVLADPWSLLGLPVAVGSWVPILLARVSHAASSTSANWLLLSLTCVEVLSPGLLAASLLGFLGRQQARLQDLSFQGASRPTPAQTLVLVLLGGVALVLWKQVGAAGYQLDLADFARLGWKFFALFIGPGLLYLWLNIRATRS